MIGVNATMPSAWLPQAARRLHWIGLTHADRNQISGSNKLRLTLIGILLVVDEIFNASSFERPVLSWSLEAFWFQNALTFLCNEPV